jgi:thiazole/oxazole-forming peptide maturase SagD family component
MTEILKTPVTFGHWVVEGGKLTCKLQRKTLIIRAPKKLLIDVLNCCDGTRSWEQVVASLSERWEGKTLSAFLAELVNAGALVDASLVLAHWADLAQLPAVTQSSATSEEISTLHLVAEKRLLTGQGSFIKVVGSQKYPLAKLLESRQSTRTFADESITTESLHAVLWAAHGVTRQNISESPAFHRTIASGGSMHSARWFVVVMRQLISDSPAGVSTSPGIYEAKFHQLGGVSLSRIAGKSQHAWHCLLDPRVLTFASALILPICDFSTASRKYGNRAVLYALMEIGQALQNAQLMAVQIGATSMLRGDTIGHQVLDLLGLNALAGSAQFLFSVPSMAVGAKASAKQLQQQRVENLFKISPGLSTTADAFTFSSRPVAYLSSPLFAGNGKSDNPTLAMVKAESEAWERAAWASPLVANDKKFEIGSIAQINLPIDPRTLVAYSENQYSAVEFPLVKFSTNRKYLWTKAINTNTGNRHGVMVDCVYAYSALPERFQKGAYANTSTSGLAAGTTFDDALCRAALELIERDAFVCAWLDKQSPSVITMGSLPGSAIKRIKELNSRGFRIVVSNISTDWASVVSFFAQSSRLPLTTITAAAHFSAEQALEKALDELELQVAYADHSAPPKNDLYPMRKIERYYRSKKTFRRSDFYVATDHSVPFKSVGRTSCQNWLDLQTSISKDGFALLAVDITPDNAAIVQGRVKLNVVRAFIPGLLPIWFEAGQQPRGMARFLEYTSASARRHAGQAFIHPFT